MTEDATTFNIATGTTISGIQATVSESCSMAGTTSAVCTAAVSLSEAGESTVVKTTTTVTGTDMHYYQIPITGGANMLTSSASVSNSATYITLQLANEHAGLLLFFFFICCCADWCCRRRSQGHCSCRSSRRWTDALEMSKFITDHVLVFVFGKRGSWGSSIARWWKLCHCISP